MKMKGRTRTDGPQIPKTCDFCHLKIKNNEELVHYTDFVEDWNGWCCPQCLKFQRKISDWNSEKANNFW